MSIFEQKTEYNPIGRFSGASGIHLAEVTNIKDPEKLNRVKCKPISTKDDIGETNWAWVSTFMSGNSSGATFLPSVGDLVLLAYLGGDIHTPCIIGCIYDKEKAAPYSYDTEANKNDIRSIKTPGGTEILMDDTSGKEKLSITTNSGSTFLIDDEKKTISVKDSGGENSLVIDSQGGNVTIKAKTKLTIDVGGNKLTIDNTGAAKLDCKSKIEMKAAQMKLEASGTLEAKSNGQLTLSSSGMTQVKGSMLKLN